MPTPSTLRAIVAFLAISASLISFACLEFMLEEVQKDFSMTSDETMVVAQIASGACLLVVFLVGVLADRSGDRRVMSISCGAFCFGAVVVAIAPHPGVLLLGLSIGGLGTIAMAIVGLSILTTTYPETRTRARAFGVFALIAPLVAIIVPLVVSVILPVAGWRSVTVLWILVGLVTAGLTRHVVPAVVVSRPRSELVTPALAGVTLASVALSASFFSVSSSTGQHAGAAIVMAVVALVALVTLILVMRRTSRPTLDLRSMLQRGSIPVFTAVFVVNGINLFFFTYLLLQYRYHQSLFETAMFLILPQATAAGGAIVGGRPSARWGSARVATMSLICASVLSLGVFAIGADSPAIAPVVFLSIVAVPISAAIGPLTQSVMDLAPADGTGATSALRNSSANLGVAVAGLVSATIVFDELDADTALDIEAFRQQAGAFHLAGTLCAVAYLGAALLMVAHMVRRVGLPAGIETGSGGNTTAVAAE